MSFETSVGTSDADSITVMGRDLARDLMGKATLSELAFLVVQRPHAHAGGGAPLRRRAGLARRSRPHPHRPRRAAHPYGRAGIPAGGGRGRPAGCGERLPGCRGGHGAVSRRARARTWRAPWRASSRRAGESRGSATRSTRSRTRARRGSTRSPRRPGLTGSYLTRLTRAGGRARAPDRPRAADQRRGRGRGGAGRPRLPGPAPARIRAAGADRGVARSPRGRDAEPYRDAPLPRGG